MIITVANTKGGVGKTTSSILLASALVDCGCSVEVWDADPQGSATLWAEFAREDGERLAFDVKAVNKALIELCKPVCDWVVIDTPPGSADIVQAAINSADLVVIPTLASGVDLQRVWPTLEAASHKMRAVLLTSAEPRTMAHTATIDALNVQGAPVFSTMIPKRQAIRGFFGSSPTHLFGYDKLVMEINEVLAS